MESLEEVAGLRARTHATSKRTLPSAALSDVGDST
jgi:hypothetical protein